MTDQQNPDDTHVADDDALVPANSGPGTGANEAARPPLRLWPATLLVGLQWLTILVSEFLRPGSMVHVMCMSFAPLIAAVGLFIWWMFASRGPTWRDRFVGLSLFILFAVVTFLTIHPTMAYALVFHVLPTAATVLVLALLVTSRMAWPRRRVIVTLALMGSFAIWTTLRSDGVDGSMNAEFAWRWSSTSEEEFLASTGPGSNTDSQTALMVELPPAPQSGDWPAFRGPDRNGQVPNVVFSANWSENPPQELWRRRVGPAWSSFSVVGDYVFTQEQRGPKEVVVCYDAGTGSPCWVSEMATRFYEIASGAGPRATPTYCENRLYVMGAKGTLQCLDAATGKRIWSRNVPKDTNATVLQWGMASSPLVVGELVLAFAGGAKGKSVIAYDRHTGEIVWTSGRGKLSYSSPHLARFGDTDQVLMVTEIGLEAYDPAMGQVLWTYEWPQMGERIIQPQLIGDDTVIMGADKGCRSLRIVPSASGWTVSEQWPSRHLKPYFNDFVHHAGYCYGFDGNILACIDVSTGKRCWKGGRYGFGQLVLLVDMNALLVLSETGDVVLLKATPDEHIELGRFKAIEGKTWNHPVVAHGKLFVRNAQEAACFALPTRTGKALP